MAAHVLAAAAAAAAAHRRRVVANPALAWLVVALLLVGPGFVPPSCFPNGAGVFALAWTPCSEEEGGGICPDRATCCPTETPGVSACIPLVKLDYRAPNEPKTRCCRTEQGTTGTTTTTTTPTATATLVTGCRWGYECAVATTTSIAASDPDNHQHHHEYEYEYEYCKATDEVRNLDPKARDTPRYDVCRIPTRMQTLHGFPVSVNASESEQCETEHEHQHETRDRVYRLAYYSSVGSITADNDSDTPDASTVEKAVVVIHGSLRDADDYFCTGLSLIEQGDEDKVMVIAPWIASRYDDTGEMGRNGDDDSDDGSDNDSDNDNDNDKPEEVLVWDEQETAFNSILRHVWRYGADAFNAPISSFRALDEMVEHLASSVDRFPNLKQITVVGHSAGGQMVQRWALLSNIPAWNTLQIRAVVANPRGYAYLDDRRWFDAFGTEQRANDQSRERSGSGSNPNDPTVHGHETTAGTKGAHAKANANANAKTNDNDHATGIVSGHTHSMVFRSPTPGDGLDEYCPWYNYWIWGLQDDPNNELPCPYRDRAVAEMGSAAAIAERYATRTVIYLTGEHDTLPKPEERCGNLVQGRNRHERAVRFYDALQEYYNNDTNKQKEQQQQHNTNANANNNNDNDTNNDKGSSSSSPPPQLVHALHTIPTSDHDHSFMFQSPLGKAAIFG